MYNTKFKVKYNSIETELLDKLSHQTTEEKDYSEEDVLDICDKLYRDELLSVFELEELELETDINKSIENVWNEVIKNSIFNKIICDIEMLYFQELTKNSSHNFKQIIFCSFFSKQLFHITHKCICQQLETASIDYDLLVELRTRSIELFEKDFFNLVKEEIK